MIEDKKILDLSEETNLPLGSHELDAYYTRLKRLGKDKFLYDSFVKDNYLTKIKGSSQYFNLNLPVDYFEYFIPFEDAPLFWIMDNPMTVFIEESQKIAEKEFIKVDLDPGKLIKEYYSKWVTTARKSEKKYFAQSLYKSISKEKKNPLLSLIYGAILFSFDEVLRNSETAQSFYEQAELAIEEIQDERIKIEFRYLMKIYRGFEYFQSEKIYEANQKFVEALEIKIEGTTAKFYCSLTEIMLNNIERGFDLICDIYDYDLRRLAYSVHNNNFVLFQFFIKNPIFLNIFNYRQFAIIYNLLEEFLKGKEFGCNENLAKLRKKFEVFKELHLNEYQDPDVLGNFAFIEKLLKVYFNSSLNFFFALSSILWLRFNDTMQLVFSSIRNRFLAEINGQLKIYDQNINDLNNLILQLTKESDELKVKYKEKAKESIAYNEQQYQDQLSFLNHKLTMGMEDSHNNPLNSFKSSITYTFVFSTLVMLVTGFASYSSSYSDELTGFGQIIKAILISGGKWGVVTLIVGLLFLLHHPFMRFMKNRPKNRGL